MMMLAWSLTPPYFSQNRLESDGSYEMAAGWAFFHGELDLAIEVLSRGGKSSCWTIRGVYAKGKNTLNLMPLTFF